jgi:hypothetical protein
MKLARSTLRYAFAAGALSLLPGHVSAEPENGWWWNPAENGRGYFIESTGGVTYLAGYFYDSDGRATWLSSGGPTVDPYRYTGTLQSYRNGQTLFGAYQPPGSVVDEGPIEVKFDDDAHGTITWPGGTVAIERQIFGIDEDVPFELWLLGLIEPPFRPETGWWWNEAESGRGFSIEVQGSNIFVVSFMYDEAGNPIWYFSAGPLATPEHYEGEVLLFAGGQTLSGPYRTPTHEVIGRMTIDFSATDDATISVTDPASGKTFVSGAISKRAARTRAVPQLPRTIFGPNDQWPQWVGFAKQALTDITDAGTTGTFTTNEVTTFDLQWIRSLDRPPEGVLAWYVLSSTSRAIYDFSTNDTSNGCKQSALENYGGLDGTLLIRYDLTYSFDVRVQNPIATVYQHCDDGMGNVSSDVRTVYPGIRLTVPFVSARHIFGMSSVRTRTASTVNPKMIGFHVGHPTYRWELVAESSSP